jgi:transposase
MSAKTINRPVMSVDRSNQLDLLDGLNIAVSQEEVRRKDRNMERPIIFNDPDPKEIFLGGVRLDNYLRSTGDRSAFVVRRMMEQHDWSKFEKNYRREGRRAYAPRCMLGLILYGVMHGVSSLRDLERLARVDLGCLWVSGGIQPDHSIIGRFIQQHEDLLSEESFDNLVRQVLKATGSNTQSIAGDGTVVEAAASRYKLLKLEAAQEAAQQARQAAQANPEDNQLARRSALADEVQSTLEQRQAVRKHKGKNADGLQVSPIEPQAVVQPLKDKKTFAPSYKPSVLANKARVIIAQTVDGSSETKVVEALLDKAKQHGNIQEGLFDAGYHSIKVIEATQVRRIELLCPEGRSEGKDWNKQSDKYYPKNQFHYDSTQDAYHCPAGNTLVKVSRYKGTTEQPGYIAYGTSACGDCAQQSHCTKSARGRRIKRYEGDEAKDALRLKMKEPEVRRRYVQRQAMVEPVFSVLKLRQGLRRFKRRGLKGVQTEFALHAMAYNLSRVVALAILIALYTRFQAVIIELYKNYSTEARQHFADKTERYVALY